MVSTDAPDDELPARATTVGRMAVRRLLPQRTRRTVGPWCFADILGPGDVTPERGLDIGPHPHTGLHTVTWLVEGVVRHRDSLGVDQTIAPGQLNLMTAGRGVAHAEEAAPPYAGPLLGIQLWIAQPDATRHDAPAFEHHGDLPRLDVPGGEAIVVLGELEGVVSPARRDSPLIAVELTLSEDVTIPLEPSFEHALVVLHGAVRRADRPLGEGHGAYLASGRDELALEVEEPTRALLIGGEPLGEDLVLWWNFVGRDAGEVDRWVEEWNSGDGPAFGAVTSGLARVPAPLRQRRVDNSR